jgi:hypothetical protein
MEVRLEDTTKFFESCHKLDHSCYVGLILLAIHLGANYQLLQGSAKGAFK